MTAASTPHPRALGLAGRWHRLRGHWHSQPAASRAMVLAGVLALLAAAALQGLALPAWQAQTEATAARWQAERRALRRTPPPLADAAPLAAPDDWPAVADAEARIARLLHGAAGQGLGPVRSQQQWVVLGAPQAGLSALQLSVQTDGPYAGLRAWVAQALADDPHLVLDALRLRRSTPQQPLLEAELQWTLLQRGERPPPAAGAGR